MTPQFRYVPKGKAARIAALTQRSGALEPIRPALVMPPALMAKLDARKASKEAFRPSAQQADYFKWIREGSGNAILRACAGAGKSTTLVQGLPYMSGSIFFGAFGKDAAADIKAKVAKEHFERSNLRISTMHAAGFGEFMRMFPQARVVMNKTYDLISDFAHGQPNQRLIEQSSSFISKMVSFGRQFLIGCPGYPMIGDMDNWLRLCEHFSADQDLIDEVKTEQAMLWVWHIYQRSIDQLENVIDFDDMIFGPIYKGIRMFPNDWVIVDEAQDTNNARRELAKRLLKPGGRFVSVGDDRQAVFGFTGASHDSLDILEKEFNCQVLNLSVTYRCPKAVVAYTKTIDPEYIIEAHESAPDGLVRSIKYEAPSNFAKWASVIKENQVAIAKPWFIQDLPNKEDAILCRYTKPLIMTAYAMIREGIACKVEGRDLGKNLINLARLWRISSISKLEERLEKYLAREIKKAREANSARREQEVEDRVRSLKVFIERCRALGKSQISDLVAEIEALFADNISGMITLATGHRAKGREWSRVFWLECAQRGRISKQWEQISERNLRIVIATRSKQDLIFVPEGVHDKKELKT